MVKLPCGMVGGVSVRVAVGDWHAESNKHSLFFLVKVVQRETVQGKHHSLSLLLLKNRCMCQQGQFADPEFKNKDKLMK